MSFKDESGEVGKCAGELRAGLGEVDAEMAEALCDFRLSVHAWSDAAMSRPRTAFVAERKLIWRQAAAWGLGCMLIAAGVSGGSIYQHRRHEAGIAQARIVEQQKLAAQQKAQQEDEDLLAMVDKDVSRQVPSAMEPLALMMAGDVTR